MKKNPLIIINPRDFSSHEPDSLLSEKLDYTVQYSVEESSLSSVSNPEIYIPLSILNNNSSLQAIVKYLHEILQLKFSDIAGLLNRDQRTIWNVYSQAKNISLGEINISFSIPLSIFSLRNLSVLESIVFHLKSVVGLSSMQISQLLGKNYRTIWTVYQRALKKLS